MRSIHQKTGGYRVHIDATADAIAVDAAEHTLQHSDYAGIVLEAGFDLGFASCASASGAESTIETIFDIAAQASYRQIAGTVKDSYLTVVVLHQIDGIDDAVFRDLDGNLFSISAFVSD